MVQLPNHMPAHHSNKVPGNMAWLHLEMGLNSHEVIGDSTGNGGLHDEREKLKEWAMLVSWPQQ